MLICWLVRGLQTVFFSELDKLVTSAFAAMLAYAEAWMRTLRNGCVHTLILCL